MSQATFDTKLGGRYHLIARLGEGGMAMVYLAMVDGLGGFRKLVVLKILKAEAGSEHLDIRAMFLDEASLAARMHHPNVVQTLDVVEETGTRFLVMEYLDGQPLHRLLRRARPKPDIWALPIHLRILADALCGLHYAHELCEYDGRQLGLVHRDVSPHNVFVTYDGHVKLVDFGVAKHVCSEQRTRAGVIKGKIAYMAPEHAAGRSLDRRADIFSAGVMLFEALSGHRFWHGHDEMAVLRKLLAGALPDYAPAIAGAPPRLREACLRALAVAPDDRFGTAAELQVEIEKWLDESGASAGASDVGRAIAALFTEERKQIQSTIEERIRGLERQTASQQRISVPDLGVRPSYLSLERSLPTGPASTSDLALVGESGARGGRTSQNRVRRTTASGAIGLGIVATLPLVVGLIHWAAPNGAGRGGSAREPVEHQAPAGVAVHIATPVPKEPPSVIPSLRDSVGMPSAPFSPSAPSATVPIPLRIAPAASIALTLHAIPSRAVWALDGVPLPGNPATLTLPGGTAVHQLRAEAPGYVPVVRTVTAERDVDVGIVLEPARHRARGRPSTEEVVNTQDDVTTTVSTGPARTPTAPVVAAPPAGSAQDDGVLSLVPTTRRVRKLDSYNPYGP